MYATEPRPSSLDEIAWFEGRWRGDRKGDTIEEHWSGPDGGTLMGMFRCIRAGQVRFFELCVIEVDGVGLVLRIKHFHPGLKGWEAQDECVALDLVAIDVQRAVWCKREAPEGRWLVYERTEGNLRAWFENAGETPNPSAGFTYELIP